MKEIEFDNVCNDKCTRWGYCSRKHEGKPCDEFATELINDSELLTTEYYKGYTISKWHWVVEDSDALINLNKIIYTVVETKYGVVNTLDKAREYGVPFENYEDAIAYIDKPKYSVLRSPDGTLIRIYDNDDHDDNTKR